VGDEGGFAPKLASIEDALECMPRPPRTRATSWAGRFTLPGCGEQRVLQPRRHLHLQESTGKKVSGDQLWTSTCSFAGLPIVSVEDDAPRATGPPGRSSLTSWGQGAAGGRRSFCHQRQVPAEGHRYRDRQRHPGQGQPDRVANRDAGRGATGAGPSLQRVLSHRSGEPKMPPLRTLPWPPTAADQDGSLSRTDRLASTTNCCASSTAGPQRCLCGAQCVAARLLRALFNERTMALPIRPERLCRAAAGRVRRADFLNSAPLGRA